MTPVKSCTSFSSPCKGKIHLYTLYNIHAMPGSAKWWIQCSAALARCGDDLWATSATNPNSVHCQTNWGLPSWLRLQIRSLQIRGSKGRGFAVKGLADRGA